MMPCDVAYWIKTIDFDNLKSTINGRNVYIWGAYSKGIILCEALESNGILVSGLIDSFNDAKNYCGRQVFKPDNVINDKSKFFVLVAVESVREEIIVFLKKANYIADTDYIYFAKNTPYIEISSLRGIYEDNYNNRFVYNSNTSLRNIIISCQGGDNYVAIEKGLSVSNSGGGL